MRLPFRKTEAPPVLRLDLDRHGRQAFTGLVDYLKTGFIDHAQAGGTGARFPGLPSINGGACDRMEAFSRLASFLAAWLSADRSDRTAVTILCDGLTNGTDPKGRGFWGDVGPHDQRLCEAADIALAVWIGRNWLPSALGERAWGAVMSWLNRARLQDHKDNNWALFPATIDHVLLDLGEGGSRENADAKLERVRSFACGGGLFRDGPDGPADWYNAWGFHYHLGWIERISGGQAPAFGGEMRRQCLPLLLDLVSPAGVPIFGRSLHYRGATVAPLALSVLLADDVLPPGVVKRAVSAVWNHHLAHGMLANGTITQGYHGFDPIWVDAYSGPASPLWSLRGLIPLLLLPPSHPFWTTPSLPLPVEQGDFEKALGCRTIGGDRASGDVWIERTKGGLSRKDVPITRPGRLAEIKGRLRGWIVRPDNRALRYDLKRYSSLRPFCLPAADHETSDRSGSTAPAKAHRTQPIRRDPS